MNRQLTDIEIEAAIVQNLPGPAQSFIEQLRETSDPRAMHPTSIIRIAARDVAALVSHDDHQRETIAELAMEARASRSNIQLFESIPPAPRGYCSSCRCSAPLVSMTGSDKPVQRVIARDPLACRLNPPVLRVVGTTPVITSVFPPVHPDQGCDQWQARDVSERQG